MDQDRPDLPEDFSDVEQRLNAARPSFSELELDKIKLRAVARATRPGRTGGKTKGIALRSRVLRIAVSLLAFGGTAIGGIAAFDAFASASSSQYGSSTICGVNDSAYFSVTATPTNGVMSASANIGQFTVTLESCSTNLPISPNTLDGGKNVSLPVLFSCTTSAPTGSSGGTPCSGTSYFGAQGATGSTNGSITDNSTSTTFYFGYDGTGTVDVVASGPNNTGGYFPVVVPGYQAETIDADQLVLTNPVNGVSATNANLGAITVTLENASGMAINATGNLTVNLAGAPGTSYFATSKGGTDVTHVTITGGTKSTTFYYGNNTAGTPTVTASATGDASATQAETIGASKLAITSTAVNGISASDANLGPVTVQLEDAAGNAVTAGSNVSVTISSSTGTGYANTTKGGTGTTVTIPSGSSSVSFYYGNNTAGTPTLTAASTGLTSITQTETIDADQLVITTAAVSGPSASDANLGPITVTLENASGTAINATGNLTVNLAGSPGTSYFATSKGGADVTHVTITGGTKSTTFYYGDSTAGTPTVTASATGDASATQVETIQTVVATQLAITTAAITGLSEPEANLGSITVQLENAGGTAIDAGSGGVTVNLSDGTGTSYFSLSQDGSTVTSVTIPGGSSSVSFYYGNDTAGTPTITAAATGLTSATQTETVEDELDISNPAANGVSSTDANLGPITITFQNGVGQEVAAGSGGLTVNISSSSGTGYANTSQYGTGSTVTIQPGDASVSFYYGNSTAGTPTITASATGEMSGTQTETIVSPLTYSTAGAAKTYTTTGSQTVTEPTGSTDDLDILVVSGSSTNLAVTTPSGWTLLGTSDSGTVAGNESEIDVFWQTRSGTSPSVDLTAGVGTTTPATAVIYDYHRTSGTLTPALAGTAGTASGGPGGGFSAPVVPTTSDSQLEISAVGQSVDGGSDITLSVASPFTQNSGTAVAANGGTNYALSGIGDDSVATEGTTPAAPTWSTSNTNGYWTGVTGAFQ